MYVPQVSHGKNMGAPAGRAELSMGLRALAFSRRSASIFRACSLPCVVASMCGLTWSCPARAGRRGLGLGLLEQVRVLFRHGLAHLAESERQFTAVEPNGDHAGKGGP